MTDSIPFLSLFSGVGTASVALDPEGYHAVACSEIDPFPSAVLQYHYPDVPNLGDITRIDWKEFNDEHEHPTLIVGGSPCTTFSIAGLRTGLEGVSGLLLDYVEAVRAVRPRFFLLENVPGILTCDGGRDYARFLSAVGEYGYDVSWRVLDSEFFGSAQRRRRLYALGSLDGPDAGQVLLEGGRLPVNHPTGAEARYRLITPAQERLGGQPVAGPVDSNPKAGRIRMLTPLDPQPTLLAHNGHGGQDMKPLCWVRDMDGRIRLRDLTPVECERLQGLPDGWTDVPYRGEAHPKDGPRYKACGNGFCAPVIRWIGHRLANYIRTGCADDPQQP